MRFELYQDAAKEWRWRLTARNGNKLADSGEGYATQAAARHGIALVKRTNKDTPIEVEAA